MYIYIYIHKWRERERGRENYVCTFMHTYDAPPPSLPLPSRGTALKHPPRARSPGFHSITGICRNFGWGEGISIMKLNIYYEIQITSLLYSYFSIIFDF